MTNLEHFELMMQANLKAGQPPRKADPFAPVEYDKRGATDCPACDNPDYQRINSTAVRCRACGYDYRAPA
ncbi:hypothetical protein N9878_02265 [bacterium]|nr:hypothetical protein [bacterium]